MRNSFGITVALTAVVVAPALAQSNTWNIDASHSAAHFAVKHMMVSTVRGDFGKMAGTIEFDGKDVRTIKAEATIDVSTVDTRDAKRDAHLKSADFFDTAKFPTITFKSRRAEAVSAGKFKLVGDLTIRGVTKEVTLEVEGPTPAIKDQRGNARTGATATTRINRQDFGVSWNRTLDAGGLVVGDEVSISIDLELIKPAPAASGQ